MTDTPINNRDKKVEDMTPSEFIDWTKEAVPEDLRQRLELLKKKLNE